MKKLIHVIAAAVLMLSVTACAVEPERIEVSPPFWVAEDSSTGGRVYMLGSFHMGYEGTVYPDYIIEAFDSSDSVAAELDTLAFAADRAALNEAVDYLRCPEETTAADYFGESYDGVKDFYREKGLYSSVLEGMKPYYWASVLSNHVAAECGLSSEYGTESLLLSRAKSSGKPLIELESGAQQYKTMGDIPMDIQVRSVIDCIGENYDKQADILSEMYAVWSDFGHSSYGELESFIDAEYIDSEGYAEYYELMYTSRQQRMTESIVEWLQNGERVFVFVGAMHYCAEPDILTLLEEQGYATELICGCSECRDTQAA